MSLSSIERSVASHAGIAAETVAIAVGCTIGQVHAARRRLGRNVNDGQPGRTSAPPDPTREREDLGYMARTNRSVCG